MCTVHSFSLAIVAETRFSRFRRGFSEVCLNHQTTHKNLALLFSPGIQEHRREEQRRQQEMQVPMFSMGCLEGDLVKY